MHPRARRSAALVVLSVVLLGTPVIAEPAGAAAPEPGGPSFEMPPRSRSGSPRLAPSLRDDAATGRPVLSDARPDHVSDPPAGLVTVVIETTDTAASEQAVEEHGGHVTTVLPELVEADVPPDALEHLAAAPGTVQIREPFFADLTTISEGVAETGAAGWHTDGWDAAGATVAIVDGGFAGFDSLVGTELPDGVEVDFSRCADHELTDHGTAVAEIAHDLAPAATLLLVCIETDVDFVSALGTMAANGVDVVNGSFGFALTGRGDGSGGPSTVAGAVAALRDQGILYVASAGNYGAHHFHTNATGDPVVPEGNDDFVNISPDDTFLFAVAGGGDVSISIKWDAWPRTRQDFDVYVGNDTCGLAGYSQFDQAALNLPPVEFVEFESCSGSPMVFELLIDRYSGSATPRIDLYFDGDVGQIEHVSASSLPEPASSPAVMAVGAHCVASGNRQSYSSQGPTIDGRVKPDISGPDANSTSTYGATTGCTGGFLGTSASAPHVAGAAALLRSASPDLDVAELQELLEDKAVDAGSAGTDNLYGAGKLRLGTAGDAGVPSAQPYTSTAPVRLLDTRPGTLGASEGAFGASGRTTPIGSGSTLRIQVAGIAGVPADATAVVLNVTAIAPSNAGYLTVYGAGARPLASNLNFAAQQTVAVNVTVTVAPDDRITIFNYSGSTHVVADLAGWYGPTGSGGPATARLNPLEVPTRAVDTRADQTGYAEAAFGPSGRTTPVGPGQSIPVQIAGLGGVPADATAAVVNVTAITPTSSGYLTLYPEGTPRPLASTINFNRQTIANLALVPIGTGGNIRIFNSFGNTHVVIDVIGTFRPGVGAGYVALDPPTRQLSTITGTGLRRTPLGSGGTHRLKVARYDGVPADALAVSMSVAVIKPTASGYLTVYPGTKPRPTASNLNFTSGIVLANAVISGLGTDGTVAFTNSFGSTNVIADLAGYFIDPADQPVPLSTPPPPPPTPAAAPVDSATTYQGNALHDGSNAATLFDGTPEEAWRHDFNGTLAYALLVNGRVFAVATRPDGQYGANLFALDAADGSILWGPKAIGGTYFIAGIAADGTNVYSVDFDGEVIATHQASGVEAWRRQLNQYAFTSPPTVDQGVVFVGGSGSGGTLYALGARTGSVLWSTSVSNGDHSAPTVTSDSVYVSYACNVAYRVNRTTGAKTWTRTTGCTGGGGKTAVLHGDRLYLRDSSLGPHVLATGSGAQVSTHASQTAPAFHGGKAFYVANGALTAVDLATGTTAWTKPGSVVTAPIIVDGKVIVGSSSGKVYIVDEVTGADLSSPDTGIAISPPDEHNAWMLSGLNVAESTLLVPASDVLVAYR